MQQQSSKERSLAKSEMRKGNKAMAQLHAQNAIRFEQQANMILQNACGVHAVRIDIAKAKATRDMVAMQEEAAKQMEQVVKKIDPVKVTKTQMRMDATKEKVGVVNQVMNPAGTVDAGAEDLMAALENEISVEGLNAAVNIPQGQPVQGYQQGVQQGNRGYGAQ